MATNVFNPNDALGMNYGKSVIPSATHPLSGFNSQQSILDDIARDIRTERGPDYSVTFRFVDDHVIATLTSKEHPYEFIELVGNDLDEIMKKITGRMVAARMSKATSGTKGEKSA